MRFFLIKICFYSNIYYVLMVNLSLNDGMYPMKTGVFHFVKMIK